MESKQRNAAKQGRRGPQTKEKACSLAGSQYRQVAVRAEPPEGVDTKAQSKLQQVRDLNEGGGAENGHAAKACWKGPERLAPHCHEIRSQQQQQSPKTAIPAVPRHPNLQQHQD